MPYNNCSDNINELTLLEINNILKKNYDDFKTTILSTNNLSLFNKTKSVLDIILGKTQCPRYQDNKKSLWQIKSLKGFDFGEEVDDDLFYKLFHNCADQDIDSKYYCLDKKIKEINVKEWIKNEKILDKNKATEILNDNNMSRESNQISFLYDAL